MKNNVIIGRILEKYSVTEYGTVSFSRCLPLLECRAKARIPETAQSVIVCLFPYLVEEQEGRNISRYAVVEDYHQVAGGILEAACGELKVQFPGAVFAPFVDNSPIREVPAAVLAGLGCLGKNGLLLHPKYGSFVFIGEIVTDLILDTAENASACIGCGKCAKACPGGAISEKGIDRERCLSHITQKKGELTEAERELVRQGKLLWGCDICQEVCPYNKEANFTELPAFLENTAAHVAYEEIDTLVKTRAFGFRGSGVLKRNYEILYGKPE